MLVFCVSKFICAVHAMYELVKKFCLKEDDNLMFSLCNVLQDLSVSFQVTVRIFVRLFRSIVLSYTFVYVHCLRHVYTCIRPIPKTF